MLFLDSFAKVISVANPEEFPNKDFSRNFLKHNGAEKIVTLLKMDKSLYVKNTMLLFW